MDYNSAHRVLQWLEWNHGFEGEVWTFDSKQGFEPDFRIATDRGNGAILIADDMVSFFLGEDIENITEATRSVDVNVFGFDGFDKLADVLRWIDYVYDVSQEVEFIQQYVETALWSELDDNEEPLDSRFGFEDLADEALAEITVDCENFLRFHGHLIRKAQLKDNELGGLNSYDITNAAHDFLLTRNHHGAGFWDRGLGVVGDELTAAAKVYGGVDFYVGDDGKVWC